ncbi:MAG: glycosyltransferase family 39 protein [Acidobacteriota bacterium]|nr:glycosyltransferase family 39 protein [Acidobacteriota bacterium]
MEALRNFFARYRCALTVLAVLALTAPLGVTSRAILVGSEAREAAIAKEMVETGHYFSTRLAGGPLHEKPPFFYSAVAASIRTFGGVTPLSLRFPSILLSAVTLLCTALIAQTLFSCRAGIAAAVILSTTYLFAVNAHDCVVDVSLAAFVTFSLFGFVRASRKFGAPRWGILFGLGAAGGLLAKGLVGIALSVLVTLPFWYLTPDRRPLKNSLRVEALMFPAIALIVWTVGIYSRGGSPALMEALWNQQVGRFLGFRAREYSHHAKPFYFYLVSLPGALFPWIVTAPAAIALALRGKEEKSDPTVRAMRSLLLGIVVGLLFLSIAGTKRTLYLLPLVPIAALFIGGYFDRLTRARTRRPGVADWAQFVPIGISAIAVPLVPAIADGVLKPAEILLVSSLAAGCIALGVLARGTRTSLAGASMGLAFLSLVLLDCFSLRRIDPDAGSRRFFAGVEQRVSSHGFVYEYNLNEDILGRACLALPRRPISTSDETRLVRALANPGAFLLAETRWAMQAQKRWNVHLQPVVSGRAGRRTVALYRAIEGANDTSEGRAGVIRPCAGDDCALQEEGSKD